jgi:hypothetical protein
MGLTATEEANAAKWFIYLLVKLSQLTHLAAPRDSTFIYLHPYLQIEIPERRTTMVCA